MVAIDSDTKPRGGNAGPGIKPRSRKADRSVLILPVLQLICGVILLIDVSGELHVALIRSDTLSAMMLFHLISEMFATVLLGIALYISYQHSRQHKRQLMVAESKMGKLRGDFEALVHDQFQAWELSPAETEIALMTVKGLKISEIAAARHSRESTVKSQLTAIFRKAGVGSRTELLAKFVDDFLDHSISQSR